MVSLSLLQIFKEVVLAILALRKRILKLQSLVLNQLLLRFKRLFKVVGRFEVVEHITEIVAIV